MNTVIKESFNRLRYYCELENFYGWDPYDGLNSKIFKNIPWLSNSAFAKLVWIQSFKKNPINLRKPFLIKKHQNPKALALFLAGYCNLYEIEKEKEILEKIALLKNQILAMSSENYSGLCWGYPFDWQAKAFFQPKNTPTVVVTSFVGNALLDAYKITKNEDDLNNILTIADFFLNDLNRTYDSNKNYTFSYSPSDKTAVYNAGLLGAGFLARLYNVSKKENLKLEAKKIVQYNINKQNSDGSWFYSNMKHHQWIDNFHTGFNLENIMKFQKYTGDKSFDENIIKGLNYYLNNFFTKDGKSKYYNNKTYPVDIHAPAQLIITLSMLNKFNEYQKIAEKVLLWTIDNMQNKKGYFYYQKNKSFTNKIPYMRWAQAWMFYALSIYLNEINLSK